MDSLIEGMGRRIQPANEVWAAIKSGSFNITVTHSRQGEMGNDKNVRQEAYLHPVNGTGWWGGQDHSLIRPENK